MPALSPSSMYSAGTLLRSPYPPEALPTFPAGFLDRHARNDCEPGLARRVHRSGDPRRLHAVFDAVHVVAARTPAGNAESDHVRATAAPVTALLRARHEQEVIAETIERVWRAD